jgi:DNA-binding GntR family transcriptional regulator
MKRRIVRNPLREQARSLIRELILGEEIPPGGRVNESQLSEMLGISRSPIREALGQLEREGFLVNRPGAGFSVRQLTEEEAAELYLVLAEVEALAVRLGGAPSRDRLRELEELNERIAGAAGNTADIIDLNFRWHRKLVEACGNETLQEMLEALRTRVYRYEYGYFSPREAIGKSASFHREILAAHDPFDDERAREAIMRHWLSDLGAVLPQIRVADGEAQA